MEDSHEEVTNTKDEDIIKEDDEVIEVNQASSKADNRMTTVRIKQTREHFILVLGKQKVNAQMYVIVLTVM